MTGKKWECNGEYISCIKTSRHVMEYSILKLGRLTFWCWN